MTHRPLGEVGKGAGDEFAGQRRPVAVAWVGCAGGAVPDGAARVLDGAFGVASAFAEADQGEADPGLPDDLDQPGTAPGGVRLEAGEEVVGPAGVVPGVP